MILNDKESYVIKPSLLEAAYKIDIEETEYERKWWQPYGKWIKKGKIFRRIRIQINRKYHDLYYDNQESRDADHGALIKAMEL